MTTQTAQITATYECYQNFGCTTTKEIHTIEPIILTPENFDTYITNGLLNENVPEGATIDVHGKFDNERYAFNITKPVNMLSTTGDAFFCFYSTPKLEGTSELPDYSFIITSEGSGTNITGKAITNSNVKIYINGVKYLAKTDKTGTYLLSVETTQTGVNKVSIGYSGNDKYEAYETNTTFTVTA